MAKIERWSFADSIPYAVPTALPNLEGPSAGWLDLPPNIHPGPVARVDLASGTDAVASAYSDIIRAGTAAQQESLLNCALVRSLWPILRLPRRCRSEWEEAFPELAV
jgi:hypothetical protein